MNEFLSGLLLGLGTAFIIGPVFFTLLKNAHNHGVKGGIFTALGIIISDVFVVLICYFLAADMLEKYIHQPWLKWAAAIILLVLGTRFLTQPIITKESQAGSNFRNPLTRSLIQGFLINFVNPAVFVIWITFLGLAKASSPNDITKFWIYIIGILAGILTTDILKSFGANYLAGKVKGSIFEYAFKTLGIILIIMAFRLVYLGFFG